MCTGAEFADLGSVEEEVIASAAVGSVAWMLSVNGNEAGGCPAGLVDEKTRARWECNEDVGASAKVWEGGAGKSTRDDDVPAFMFD